MSTWERESFFVKGVVLRRVRSARQPNYPTAVQMTSKMLERLIVTL